MKLPPVLASALALAAATGAGAGATIVPQSGIAGVTLGMTQAQVVSKLGAPSAVKHGTNDFGAWKTLRYPGVWITFQSGDKATSIETRSPNQRTAGGAGVGSTVYSVIVKVPGSKCLKEFDYVHCYVGTWQPGRVVTDFAVKNALVWRVVVGYVVD